MLNLTRAIGKYYIPDLSFKNNPNCKYFNQAVTANPEITKLKITKVMQFSDGVWDCVDIQKLCEHISIQLLSSSKKKHSQILSDLFDQIIAKTNNSKIILIVAPIWTDNMSCIIIEFKHDRNYDRLI
jgi:serine/threonine protein phosphatase PrpC